MEDYVSRERKYENRIKAEKRFIEYMGDYTVIAFLSWFAYSLHQDLANHYGRQDKQSIERKVESETIPLEIK